MLSRMPYCDHSENLRGYLCAAGETHERQLSSLSGTYLPSTLLRICRARLTLSATAHVSLGLEPVMSSRASRTAAMMEAHIATVLAYRALCSFSQASCRFISPIAAV